MNIRVKELRRLKAHYLKLSVEGGNTGNSVRDKLIKSDAKRNLDNLISKTNKDGKDELTVKKTVEAKPKEVK